MCYVKSNLKDPAEVREVIKACAEGDKDIDWLPLNSMNFKSNSSSTF